MKYLEISFNVSPEFQEIIIAELASIGFDSFNENEEQLLAYIGEAEYNEKALIESLEAYSDLFDVSFEVSQLEEKNWNEEWEKNYTHTEISDELIIRASHHQIEKEYKHEIIIDPRMSFGTGHHETTSLVMETQLKMHHLNTKVLDVGCGTSILSILASKLGAKEIDACDIDEWAYNNSVDNLELNNCSNITIKHGDVNVFIGNKGQYDIVIANINKNVLMSEIPLYSQFMTENGYLVLSGFYTTDIEDIEETAKEVGLTKVSHASNNKWACILLKR